MGVGISLSGLASAVANEGGIGVISCAGLGLLYPKGKGDYTEKCICGLKEEIRKARQKTKAGHASDTSVHFAGFGRAVAYRASSVESGRLAE